MNECTSVGIGKAKKEIETIYIVVAGCEGSNGIFCIGYRIGRFGQYGNGRKRRPAPMGFFAFASYD